jgi:hypothetical protein
VNDRQTSRRRFLELAGAGTTVSLAGCLRAGQNSSDDGSDTSGPNTDDSSSTAAPESGDAEPDGSRNTSDVGPLAGRWEATFGTLEPIVLVGDDAIGVIEPTDGPAVVNKLAVDDGSEIGRFRLPADVTPSTIALRDGELVGCNNQVAFVVDWETGNLLRRNSFEGLPLGQTVTEDTLYMGLRSWAGNGQSGKIQALSLDDLSTRWIVETETNVNTSPTVTDDLIVATSGDVASDGGTGILHAYDRENRAVRWERETAAAFGAPPSIVDGVVYAGTNGNYNSEAPPTEVAALNPGDGTALWEQTRRNGMSVEYSPTVVDDDLLLESERSLERIGRDDGSTVWSHSSSERITTPVDVREDTAYFATRAGELVALGVPDADVRWQGSTGAAVSTLAVTDSSLYAIRESTLLRFGFQ